MRIGVLADIHGDVANLSRAVGRLSDERVDQFVVLGDVIYDVRDASETVAILRDCGAIGVWGNHELGLCVDPDEVIHDLFDPSVLDFFSTLDTHLELGEVLFSHTLPHQDARNPASYYLGMRPHEEGALDECFLQFPHRIMLVGHFHSWFASTPENQIVWEGGKPIRLDPHQRYLFVIAAVMDGWAAVVDDQTNELVPIVL